VRFLRHLAAVVLTVGIVVGLGMLWAHASGGGTGAGGVLRRAPSGEALQRMKEIRAGAIRVRSGGGFNLADSGDLITTCEVEALLAAVVIAVSAVRRRRRRMRRGAVALRFWRDQPSADPLSRRPAA
jgi:hypothetical protein